MKKAALAVMAFGIYLVLYAYLIMDFARDGTVNLGLMHQREMTMFLGCWLSMFGIAATFYITFTKPEATEKTQ